MLAGRRRYNEAQWRESLREALRAVAKQEGCQVQQLLRAWVNGKLDQEGAPSAEAATERHAALWAAEERVRGKPMTRFIGRKRPPMPSVAQARREGYLERRKRGLSGKTKYARKVSPMFSGVFRRSEEGRILAKRVLVSAWDRFWPCTVEDWLWELVTDGLRRYGIALNSDGAFPRLPEHSIDKMTQVL